MTDLFESYGVWPLLMVAAAFFAGGFVKGAIGFALPLVAVTGAASVMPAAAAVATAILPILVSNLLQVRRDGLGPMRETMRRFWPMNLMLVLLLCLSAPLLPEVDERTFFLVLGASVGSFSALQLIGWRPEVAPEMELGVGLGVGALSGVFAGLTGIWGPPLILYLVALRLPKLEQIRAAAFSFLCGSLTLAPAHLFTGVLNAQTGMLSALAIIPTLLGMAAGQAIQDRLNVELFRRLTLTVLFLSALNLLRRAVF